MQEFFVAVSLLFILEGIWPFLSPRGFRRALQMVASEQDRALRISGLISMLSGLGLLYLVN